MTLSHSPGGLLFYRLIYKQDPGSIENRSEKTNLALNSFSNTFKTDFNIKQKENATNIRHTNCKPSVR